ncbi:MAG TPA: type I methionyl aminopeptidase [Flavobacteriales bacterium]|nr:type I methionyl aminopeptidase [Flavobacteriales bacterium]
MLDHKAKPGFKGLYGFPNTLCISINDAIVHGIPGNKALENGDVISIDCGTLINGFYGDQAYTFEVGEVSPEIKKLLRVTKESLFLGIDQFRLGNRVGDVGFAIQKHAEDNGFGVVRELVGHGLGRSMHEGPEMPNYGKAGKGKKFQNGMVVAIEPMINLGVRNVKQAEDGWTILTADGRVSAHFEHDVALIDGKPDILSSFEYIEDALNLNVSV